KPSAQYWLSGFGGAGGFACPNCLKYEHFFQLRKNLPAGKISIVARTVKIRRQPSMARGFEAPPHDKAFANRRRDPATKREAVLKTAAQLFIEKSYSRTSMNDVAERLNITKPALYHYFQNKEQILVG